MQYFSWANIQEGICRMCPYRENKENMSVNISCIINAIITLQLFPVWQHHSESLWLRLVSSISITIQIHRGWTTHEPSSIWITELISMLAFPYKCLEALEMIALELPSVTGRQVRFFPFKTKGSAQRLAVCGQFWPPLKLAPEFHPSDSWTQLFPT